jgi:hypothetical protein
MERRRFLQRLSLGVAAAIAAVPLVRSLAAAAPRLPADDFDFKGWNSSLADVVESSSVHTLSTSTAAEWNAGPSIGRISSIDRLKKEITIEYLRPRIAADDYIFLAN